MIVTLDATSVPMPVRDSLGETWMGTPEGQPAGFRTPQLMTRGHLTPILEP